MGRILLKRIDNGVGDLHKLDYIKVRAGVSTPVDAPHGHSVGVNPFNLRFRVLPRRLVRQYLLGVNHGIASPSECQRLFLAIWEIGPVFPASLFVECSLFVIQKVAHRRSHPEHQPSDLIVVKGLRPIRHFGHFGYLPVGQKQAHHEIQIPAQGRHIDYWFVRFHQIIKFSGLESRSSEYRTIADLLVVFA